MKTIAFPDGSLIGDWKRGERIAQSGRGLQWTDKPGAPGGGSCYNCHQLSPQESSHGTLGPSLLRFGATRGSGPEMQRYVYGKIYNAKAYNLCSQMPRLGLSGTLTPEQIKDLVGLLLDPASPVNRLVAAPRIPPAPRLAAAAGASLRPRASAAQAAAELYDVPPFGNVSLLHITDTHAQLLPVYFREPTQGSLRESIKARPETRARVRLYASRLRGARPALRQGRRLRAPRHAGEAAARLAPARAAARRRRQLAGLGDRAVDAGRGHDRRAAAPRRGLHDGALGVHLRRRSE